MNSPKLFFLFSLFLFVISPVFAEDIPQNSIENSPKFSIEFLNIQEGEIQKISSSWAEKEILLSEEISAIGVKIPNNTSIKISLDAGKSWKNFVRDIDGDTEEIGRNSQLIFLPEGTKKFSFQSDSKEKFLEFFFLQDSGGSQLASTQSISLTHSGYNRDAKFFQNYNIIPRETWGANESIRYGSDVSSTSSSGSVSATVLGCKKLQALYPEDFVVKKTVGVENGKKLKWGYRYSPFIQKIAIHHTAENSFTEKSRSAEEIMRSTYAYHTGGRGWGDIGYNFVISPDGKIFEGRAGGDFVVGGHIYCANVQTVGIAMMGNFQSIDPPEAQVKALQNLLRGLSEKYDIDIQAESSFHGKFTSNVIGHRDYGQTACPGENLYFYLPFIREGVDLSGLIFGAKKNLYRMAKFISTIKIRTLKPGKKEVYTLKFSNTGSSTWDSSTWLFADLPSTDISIVPLDGKNIFYAAKLNQSQVLPGQTGSFTVSIVGGNDEGLHTIEFTPVVDSRRISKAAIVVPVLTTNSQFSAQVKNFSYTRDVQNKNFFDISLTLKNSGNTIWLRQNHLVKIQAGTQVKFVKMQQKEILPNQEVLFSTRLWIGDSAKKITAELTDQKGKVASGASAEKIIIKNSVETKNVETKNFLSLENNVREILRAKFLGVSERKFVMRREKGTLVQKYFSIENLGNKAWKRGEIFLVRKYKRGNKSTRIIEMNQASVAPGQSATFFIEAEEVLNTTQKYSLQLQKGKRKIRGGKILWYIKKPKRSVILGQAKRDPGIQINNKNNSLTDDKKQSPIIRIKLGYSSNFAVISGENFSITLDGKKILSSQKNIRIVKNSGKIFVNGMSGDIIKIIPAQKNDILTLDSWNNSPSWNKNLNDNQFRGNLEFRIYKGLFTTINELGLEDYLKGLAEVSDNAPVEKQKAIALVARTYAQFYLSKENRKYPGAPYDGDDSPASFQKYLGYGYEKRSPQFSKAVQNTTGEIITYNGRLIKTPFFSESDGRTKSAQEVWGWTHTPYLKSVDDSFCKSGNGTLKGHGVGLSGCGAEEMARDGKNYREIVKWYYAGVKIN